MIVLMLLLCLFITSINHDLPTEDICQLYFILPKLLQRLCFHFDTDSFFLSCVSSNYLISALAVSILTVKNRLRAVLQKDA